MTRPPNAELEPTRVLLVFSAAGLGGAERSLTLMALATDPARARYTLCTLGGEGHWSSWLRAIGGSPVVLDALEQGIPSWSRLRTLIGRIRSLRPQIIYVVGIRASTCVRLLKPFLGPVRIVNGIRTTFQPGSALAGKFKLPELLLRGLTDAYIANSNAGADSLVRLSRVRRDRIRVIPNGVAVPPSPPAESAAGAPVVAVIANLHPLKGHREFLSVVALVVARCPNAIFHFVGRDDMQGEIQRLFADAGMAESVRFSGYLGDVTAALAEACVFVLPSRMTEGAPTAVLEAQAAARPVVAFDVGGVAELVRDGSDGRLAPCGDDAAMARAVCELLQDRPRAREMGLNGWAKMRERFSVQACAEAHAAVWQELIAR